MNTIKKQSSRVENRFSEGNFSRIRPLYKKPLLLLYFLTLVALFVYSYALVDPNFTLFTSPIWTSFRNIMVQFGYYQRGYSWLVFLGITIILFIYNYLFTKKIVDSDPVKLSLCIAGVLLLSYPFLSHDFFNYLFDAKIVTVYHQNPYFHKALDYPVDQWLRFMHWTHRTYPYGPSWLAISLIPSFFSFGKLILNFFLFKVLFAASYSMSVYILSKKDIQLALFFATNPLVIYEGLISPHNDLVAVSLALFGLYYVGKKGIVSRFLLLLSGGIKYITLPLVFFKNEWKHIVFLATFGLVGYISITGEIQPWYYLNAFIFLLLYKEKLFHFNLFFMGLVFSYYPYIRFGPWDSPDKIELKHTIIIIFFIINCVYILIKNRQFLLRNLSKR